MRLIDADAMDEKLFYKQIGGKDVLITAENSFEMTKVQPTAYDVDNVVEQLETDSSVKLYGSGNSDNYLIPVKRAIDIVKDGGINDN